MHTPAEPAPTCDTSSVCAVLVTYNPELDRLRNVLSALNEQGCTIVAVDNGSAGQACLKALFAEFAPMSRTETIWNSRNIGLAAAQNQGIESTRRRGASYVLLMDQDTILPTGAVKALLSVSLSLTAKGRRVAAVGPGYIDRSSGAYSLVWQHKGINIKRTKQAETLATPDGQHEIAHCDFVIASGSLIALDTLSTTGAMEEALFIDLVDVEWGLRAQSMGYGSYQIRSLEADHEIGIGRIRIGPVSAPLHSPIRNYYWVRNAFKLSRRRGIPAAWRIYFARRATTYLIFYTFFGDSRRKRGAYLWRGLRDGLR